METLKTNQQIAIEVIRGLWGNGYERRVSLSNAGYDPDKIQSIVNALMAGDVLVENKENEFVVTGTEMMNVTVNLSKYKGVNMTFVFGGD